MTSSCLPSIVPAPEGPMSLKASMVPRKYAQILLERGKRGVATQWTRPADSPGQAVKYVFIKVRSEE